MLVGNLVYYNQPVGFFVPANAEPPHGISTIELHEQEIKPVVSRSNDVIGLLKENLIHLGLIDMVSILE